MAHQKLFIALLGASSAHAENSRKEFACLGLTEGQPKILYILLGKDGVVQKDLAEICGIRQSTLTVLLGKLEEQGYIYKEVCYVSGRKRAFEIYLTEQGRAMAEKLNDVVENLERKSFAGFSEQEKRTILELLARVEENLKQS